MGEKLLDIKDLVVKFYTDDAIVHAVNGLDLSICKGETLGLVGETGAGKTTAALSIMGLIDSPPGKIHSGNISYKDTDLLAISEAEYTKIRGAEISMIFQDPMTALNPVLPVVDQIAEVIEKHQKCKRKEAEKRAIEMLEVVRIPANRAYEYPHQFSGGMKQRVIIAKALVCNPSLLIADEPTTALDVTIQAQVLEMMKELRTKYNTSMIMITHDFGIVAETCDKVAIMYAGEILESGTLSDIFENARHPYTIGLFGAIPNLKEDVEFLYQIEGLMPDPAALPSGCPFSPRCAYAEDICYAEKPQKTILPGDEHMVKCHIYQGGVKTKQVSRESKPAASTVCPSLTVPLVAHSRQGVSDSIKSAAGISENCLEVINLRKLFNTPSGPLHAVDGVSFTLEKGRTIGIVGESGCGKSTLGRVISRLLDATDGKVLFKGENILEYKGKRLKDLRRETQMIFQDPFSSLDPRKTVYNIIAEPLITQRIHRSKAEVEKNVVQIMELVGLAERLVNTYPHELDGGRRQRIGIARALALEPSLIVCDEPVSALDVSIQAQILNLLKRLQNQFGYTYIFITHDLSVVKHFTQEVLVMYLGQMVEKAPVKEIFENPRHPYTQALLSSIPAPEIGSGKKRVLIKGEITSPINPPNECLFADRCAYACDKCREATPPMVDFGEGHFARCYSPI